MGRIRSEQLKEKLKILIMLIPFIAIITFTIFLGTIEMVKQSLGYIPFLNMNEYSLDYYKEVLTDKNFYSALFFTIYVSVVPTLISLFLGTMFAIQIYLKDKKHSKVNLFIQNPIIIPYSVYTFFIIILLMQTGLISRIFYSLNIITNPNDFPLFIYDKLGIGMLVVYVLKQTPFVFLIVSSALLRVDKKYVQASYNLGATKFQTIKTVILPMIKSSLLTAFLLCFAFNFGSFEVPYLLLNPSQETLPILAYKKYINTDISQRPYAMVLNTLILIMCLILLVRYLKYSSKINYENKDRKN